MYGLNGELLLGKSMGLEPIDPNIKSSSSSSESPLVLLLLFRRDNRPRRVRVEPALRMLERLGLLGLFPEIAARRSGLLVLRFILNSERGPCLV